MSGPLVHLYSTGRAIAGLTAASAMPRSTSRAAIRFEFAVAVSALGHVALTFTVARRLPFQREPRRSVCGARRGSRGCGGLPPGAEEAPSGEANPLGGVCNGRSWAEATLRTGSPKLHPGLVAIRELDAGRFEDGGMACISWPGTNDWSRLLSALSTNAPEFPLAWQVRLVASRALFSPP